MSGSVEQRTKGQPNQVSNGPSSKENADFEYLQGQPPQGYGSAQMSSPNVSDPYMSSYYPPYMSFANQSGLNDGSAWSTGGDPMSFLGGYPGQMGNDYMSSNMFSFDYTQAGFGWGFPGGEYSAWSTSSQGGRKSDDRGAYADYSYIGTDYMNGEMNERDGGMKSVDQGLKGMTLNDKHEVRDTRQSGGGGSGGGSGSGGSGSSQRTWASIAKQPARPQPQLKSKTIPRAPVLPSRHNMDIGTWDNKNSAAKMPGSVPRQGAWASGASRGRATAGPYAASGATATSSSASNAATSGSAPVNNGFPSSAAPPPPREPNPVLDKLRAANQYNPKNFNLNPDGARFFIIKSYSEDDIHRSIKYGIWCSTEHGNKRLDGAFKDREGKGPLYLLFSVNGSGHFCGMAQMMSLLDYNTQAGVWAQDKWKGQFEVKWIYVKDVPNSQLRHIRLENNENKPVTNSRDTQEVPPEKGKQVLRIIHQYRHTTSIFDDFSHYEKRQEEDSQKVQKPGRQDRRGDRDGDRGDRGDRDRSDRGGRDRENGMRGGDRGDRDRNDRGDRDRRNNAN